jgi:hypothetical protein
VLRIEAKKEECHDEERKALEYELIEDGIEGGWCFTGENETSGFDECEKIGSIVKAGGYGSTQIRYSVGSMQTAFFQPSPGNALLPIRKSLEIIARHVEKKSRMEAMMSRKGHLKMESKESLRKIPKILFIGDSLSSQLFISFQCELERKKITTAVDVNFLVHVTLGRKVECDVKCVKGSIYLYNDAKLCEKYKSCFCMDCPNGTNDEEFLRLIETNRNNPANWTREVENMHPDVDVIILNTGAWFSHRRENYHQAMIRLAKDVTTFTEKGVVVAFVLLPIDHGDIYKAIEYGHTSFPLYNEMARIYLSEVGAVIIDVVDVASDRFRIDANITIDNLHWRSPSRTAIPNLINQLALHNAAMLLK